MAPVMRSSPDVSSVPLERVMEPLLMISVAAIKGGDGEGGLDCGFSDGAGSSDAATEGKVGVVEGAGGLNAGFSRIGGGRSILTDRKGRRSRRSRRMYRPRCPPAIE